MVKRRNAIAYYLVWVLFIICSIIYPLIKDCRQVETNEKPSKEMKLEK